MFFSRCLNDAEKNYQPTKLKVADVVQVVKKVRYIVEANLKPLVIIYTDYLAAVPILRQTLLNTASTNKLNLRLVRASQYLSSFNLELRYKAGKSNIVPDALSRLLTTQTNTNEYESILDALYGLPVAEAFRRPSTILDLNRPIIYYTTFIDIIDNFKLRLRQAYKANEYWKKIRDILKPSADNTNEILRTKEYTQPGLPFVMRDDLLYYINGEGIYRLCMPSLIEKELFEQVYNLLSYGEYYRYYNRLSYSMYIRYLLRYLRNYISYYL